MTRKSTERRPPKATFSLIPNTPEQRTRAGRYLLGMRADGAEDGAELLDMFDLDPAECRKKPAPAAP